MSDIVKRGRVRTKAVPEDNAHEHHWPTGRQPRLPRKPAIPRTPDAMPWVKVALQGRYFMTEAGEPFLIIGQNDAVKWPDLWQLHREYDLPATEGYIRSLSEHGVTIMRIMLEYCQDDYWYFEKPAGKFVRENILYWDDLIGLCERYKIRLLLTPWDTFFMARRWESHPYSAAQGGPCETPGDFLTNPDSLALQRERWKFIIDRWGNSSAIFAYDLLNEIHEYWGGDEDEQIRWVAETATFIKQRELERYGKHHLVTVSIFGATPEGRMSDLIFREPTLDFASTHIYWYGKIDAPENTIDCALAVNEAIKYALQNIHDDRPFTDSESGPIHLYLDLKQNLSEEDDNEYYHNMSWAHLASGGAGSGLRWPCRHPHCLTETMHRYQGAMARVCASLDWAHFRSRNIDHLLRVVEDDGQAAPVVSFGVSDAQKAFVWLLHDTREHEAEPLPEQLTLLIEQMQPGIYSVEFWDTYAGELRSRTCIQHHAEAAMQIDLLPIDRDLAVIVKPEDERESKV